MRCSGVLSLAVKAARAKKGRTKPAAAPTIETLVDTHFRLLQQPLSGPLPAVQPLKPGWSAATVIGHDPQDVVATTRQVLERLRGARSALLFAISRSLPPEQLQAVLDAIQSADEPFAVRIGCLSDALPTGASGPPQGTLAHGVALAAYQATDDETVVPFVYPDLGDDPVTLGRQITPAMDANERHIGSLNTDRSELSAPTLPLPPPLDLAKEQRDNIRQTFLFASGSPQKILDSWARSLPFSAVTALVGASTPFVTGRPSTLFYNGQILSTGAVGLAISQPSAPPRPQLAKHWIGHLTDYVKGKGKLLTDSHHVGPRNSLGTTLIPAWYQPGLQRLGDQMKARGIFGNVVRKLDGQPATAKLLELMRDPAALKPLGDAAASEKSGPAYEDVGGEVYLGVVRATTKKIVEADSFLDIFPVKAGGMSKGSLALDTSVTLASTATVQLFFRPSYAPLRTMGWHCFRALDAANGRWRELPVHPKPTFALLNIAESVAEATVEPSEDTPTQVLIDAFVAGTTNGIGQLSYAWSSPKNLPRSMGSVPGSATLLAL